MPDVDYVVEQNKLVRFYLEYVLFIAIIVGVIYLGITTYNLEEPKPIEPLSQNQQIALMEQISYSGFKETLRNGCYEHLVEKIQNNTWSNTWCANKYNHLNLKDIK